MQKLASSNVMVKKQTKWIFNILTLFVLGSGIVVAHIPRMF
jgi:hypothetical protein